MISEILLAFGCYILAALQTEGISAGIYLLYDDGLTRIGIVVLSIVIGVYLNDLYSNVIVVSRTLLVQQFCLSVGIAFIAQALLSYVYPILILPRWQMILGSLLVLFLLPAWRMTYSEVAMRILGRQRVLFLGSGEMLQKIAERMLERPEIGMESIGHLANDCSPDADPGPGPHLGATAEVREAWEKHRPDLIAVGLNERRGQMPILTLMELRLAGVRIEDAASLYEVVMGRVSLGALRPSHLVFTSEMGPNPRYVIVQRAYSLAVALAGTAVTLPVMLLVALLIRLTSRGPVVYRQRRVGLRGRAFELYKFRSMYVDAESGTGAVWAIRDDPRITPLGRWIRRLRLDELPQFFNVLKGDMAIVGPRPERPEFVRTLTEQIPFYGQRHAILPGITGWAQVNHKYGDSIEDTATKLEFDLYYLKNMTFSLDTYIIFQTLKVMLLSRGSQ